MKPNSRVIHRQHPEFGFGIVKYDEENVLGERRLQVAFDHKDALIEVDPSEVEEVPSPEADAAAGRWGNIETLQRRILAGLVVTENNQTSAFIKTTTRPLPHQVSVLDKVLSGERFGHLFADDVGLGKTIEAGLLITSVLKGERAQRVLVVSPAGVALQWQEEMEEHFSLYFSVLGIDFKGTTSAQWRNHPLVIAPIDRLKQPQYAALLREVGPFELIVCDEAHRLNASRNRLTDELQKTQNYRLFERLVGERTVEYVTAAGAPRSPRLVFLSATPHQGDDLRFLYLLNLLRPDLFPLEGENLGLLKADRLQEVMTRTPKAKARDWNGNPIFMGHTSETLEVQWSPEEVMVSRLLTQYITTSVTAVTSAGRPNPLVVMLVMHTFHKIAASSWRALMGTLTARLDVLLGRANGFGTTVLRDDEDAEDAEFDTGEFDRAFFAEERSSLEAMIARIASLPVDRKWIECSRLLEGLDREQAGCKVLFFTQFRSTQTYLREQLLRLFPGCAVELVNGDVPLLERRQARRRFEGASRFMVSTEAGGEGVNLQKACHLMVNYDLPWNPMRLQQRIGRLDRYGQKRRVSVYNLRVPDSWDAQISTRIEERLGVIQKTMGEVVAADIENYREMILGHVADQIDPAKAFREHLAGREVGVADVDRYLKDALTSMKRWESRFGEAVEPAVSDPKYRPSLTAAQFHAGYEAALGGLGLRLQESRNSQKRFLAGVYHFTLPPEFRDNQFRAGREFHVVFDREVYQAERDQDLGEVRGQPIRISLAGFGESFTDWLFQRTTAAGPNANAFSIRPAEDWKMGTGWVAVYCLRYLGRSRRMTAPDALIGVFLGGDGGSKVLETKELFELCRTAGPTGGPQVAPPLDEALRLARDELRSRIGGRGSREASTMGLSLWALIYVDGNIILGQRREESESLRSVSQSDQLGSQLVHDAGHAPSEIQI